MAIKLSFSLEIEGLRKDETVRVLHDFDQSRFQDYIEGFFRDMLAAYGCNGPFDMAKEKFRIGVKRDD